MLKMKPCCEPCERELPAQSIGANICSFECTFCDPCTAQLGACPNLWLQALAPGFCYKRSR